MRRIGWMVILFFSLVVGVGVSFLREGLAARYSQQRDIDPDRLAFEVSEEKFGYFEREKFLVPDLELWRKEVAAKRVLGHGSSDKRVEVDLTNQRVYAYEGDRMVYNFLVSTGKWGRTPAGEFRIWVKVRAQKMSGGSKELRTYYYLPNVPWVMFFYGDGAPQAKGFSFHGTYWHSNFGRPMSHGCINMRTEEAKLLYDWADPTTDSNMTKADEENPGTLVKIYGVTPRE